jgi:hypothetical protein
MGQPLEGQRCRMTRTHVQRAYRGPRHQALTLCSRRLDATQTQTFALLSSGCLGVQTERGTRIGVGLPPRFARRWSHAVDSKHRVTWRVQRRVRLTGTASRSMANAAGRHTHIMLASMARASRLMANVARGHARMTNELTAARGIRPSRFSSSAKILSA